MSRGSGRPCLAVQSKSSGLLQGEPRNIVKVGRCSSVTGVDLAVFVLIAVFGACTVLLHQRTADFMGEDVFYADAALSLLHHGIYSVNGIPETTQPPGLSAILAVLIAMFGYSYGTCVAAMAVFETLGFFACYELLRRRVPRSVAAIICIILLSSPVYFVWATRLVYSCFPYLFTTMVALLAGEEYDHSVTVRSRITWGVLFGAAVAASLLIASSTIALIGAVVAVVVLTTFQDRHLARTRMLKFLPVLMVGIAVLGLWMHRKPAPLEWSLPGYPASYFQQLKVKNGNYPELGMAKWGDIPDRITTNLLAESDMLGQLVLRHGVNRTKLAVVIVPVLLIAIGWTYSVWKLRGMGLVEWYFLGYEVIYLLWPWTMEHRFFLPIAPLACFYMWQGLNGAMFFLTTKPRVFGIIWLPLALFLTVSGTRWIYAHRITGYGDWPDELLVPIWLISAGCAFWMAYTGKSIVSTEPLSGAARWFIEPLGRLRLSPLHLIRNAGYIAIVGIVMIGVVIETRVARENLITTGLGNIAENRIDGEVLPSEVEAGIWLRSHTTPASVVMARHWPTVHHYAERKLVWFAPISDPDVLLEGIAKHRVDYVVVINHPAPYYLPDDDYCFDRLLAAHARYFQLVLQSVNLRIFRVQKTAGMHE
jgi:uncharacterized membrane protein (UPF0136 family)